MSISQTIAKAIIKTAQVFEESYDHNAAMLAQRKQAMVDYNKFYKLTLRDAAVLVNPVLSEILFLLLYSAWNDSLDWANATVAKESNDQALREAVFTALGHASMCWQPIPGGVFDSSTDKTVGDTLLKTIEEYNAS